MTPLPQPGFSSTVFAERTGLSEEALRTYHRRGLFTAAGVDARGSRRYAVGQVRQGRLLAALVGTGMPVAEAVRAVAEEDRGVVVAHLQRCRALLEQAAQHLPTPGVASVVLVQAPEHGVVVVPADLSGDLLEQARAARRDLAQRVGTPVADLPRWRPEADLPGGPRVALGTDAAGGQVAELLLVRPAGVPSPAGGPAEYEPRGCWAVTSPVPVAEWRTLVPPDGAAAAAVAVVADREDRMLLHRRVLLSHDLTAASLAVLLG